MQAMMIMQMIVKLIRVLVVSRADHGDGSDSSYNDDNGAELSKVIYVVYSWWFCCGEIPSKEVCVAELMK